MGPHTLEAFRTANAEQRQQLAEAQHVLVNKRVHDTLSEILVQMTSDVCWQMDMPSRTVVVEFSDGISILLIDGGSTVDAILIGGNCGYLNSGIRVWKRTNKGSVPIISGCDDETAEEFSLFLAARLGRIDLLFSLMAEPRLIEKTTPTRQQRRASERVTGVSMTGVWHSVSWTVGDKVTPKGGKADGDHRMPLHFCRAHWRHAKAHHEMAERRPGHSGFWTWIKHSWKGHPDFGIKLHHYIPELDPDGKSVAEISALKRAASQAASNAAIAAWQQGA